MADKISTRSAYGDALVELGKKDPNIIVMDADLSKSTMTAGFKKEFPERFFNAGIAEANLMGMHSQERQFLPAHLQCSQQAELMK